MFIIPVIDILDGNVVHAKYGERDSYLPITSVLTDQCSLHSVLTVFFKLFPFKIIYIADLNAIQNNGNNTQLILNIAKKYPDCNFWLDSGVAYINQIAANNIDNIIPVAGSEYKISKNDFLELSNNFSNLVLSLDFNESGLIENNYLLDEPEIWPENIIIMMLHRVGSNSGVDMDCLNNILSLTQNRNIYIAGGIRNKEDLEQLQATGIKGALVASALHNGAITREDLIQLIDN